MNEFAESSEKIIVFDSYDTVVAANLVKTKLDAFGVPCFLSDEHFVSLYPFRNELFPGVRLHIFQKDLVRVKEILTEELPMVRQCPVCHSKELTYEPSRKKLIPYLISGILAGLFLPVKKVYHCEHCNREFDAIDSA